VSVQLPSHVLLELIQRLERSSGSKDVSAAIASAVEFWLADQKSVSQESRSGWPAFYAKKSSAHRQKRLKKHTEQAKQGRKISKRLYAAFAGATFGA
jgi:hypothetical protein